MWLHVTRQGKSFHDLAKYTYVAIMYVGKFIARYILVVKFYTNKESCESHGSLSSQCL